MDSNDYLSPGANGSWIYQAVIIKSFYVMPAIFLMSVI